MLESLDRVTGSQLALYATAQQQAKYLSVASLAFIVYDELITFCQELEYVWQIRQFTTVRALFLINRYNAFLVLILNITVTFMVEPSDKVCMVVSNWVILGTFTQLAIVEAILVIRVWALYQRRRSILIFLLLCLVVSYGTSIAVAVLHVKTSKRLPFPAPSVITGCIFDDAPYSYVPFVCSLAIETLLFLLVFINAFTLHRSGLKVPVAIKMYRDGTFYYAIVLGPLLFTVIAHSIKSMAFIASASHLVVAVHACACSRLILCLRCYITGTDTGQYTQTVTGPRLPLTNLAYQKEQEWFLYTERTEEGTLDIPPAGGGARL